MCNVRMIEGGENLPLASEALQVGLGGASCADDLDSNVLQVVIVDPNGLKDSTHPSLTDLRNHLVGADLSALPRKRLVMFQSAEEKGLLVEHLDRILLVSQQ